MSIAIDGDHASSFDRVASVFTVQVEPCRVGVDLQSDATLRCHCVEGRPVEIARFPPSDQSTGRVGEEIDASAAQCHVHPFHELGSGRRETAVCRGDDDVEIVQRGIVEVERAITFDLDLRSKRSGNFIFSETARISSR
ncbi:MAG: hypothetical protein R2845_08560 [Thermomicrobiales bacterium]